MKRRGITVRERPGAIHVGLVGIAASIGVAILGFVIVLLGGENRFEKPDGLRMLGIMVLIAGGVGIAVFAIAFVIGCAAWVWHRLDNHNHPRAR